MRSLPAVDVDELAACVSCGLCLPHCPTFRVTGEEGRSPRGRIAAMRAVEGGHPAGDAFIEMMYTCVGCRACETACPSSVPFGRLMEGARQAVADRAVPWWQRLAYRSLEHHRLLIALTAAGAVMQRLHLLPPALGRRLSLPWLPLRQEPLEPTGHDAWLFTGCVMDAWQRSVHHDAMSVLGAMGIGVALPGPGGDCCGAMHAHAGWHGRAVTVALRVMASMPGEAPVLVDSAGCGAALKEYGHLVGTEAARAFSARVMDLQEWLAGRAERLPPPRRRRLRVAVQDPCHLRHAQRAEIHVRTVLAPYADLVELADEGRCCGAGGAYSVLQPELAGAIRDDKLQAIAAAGTVDAVASANPGCGIWLAAAGVTTRHPIEIIRDVAGLPARGGNRGR
jgi:glycolate oxidase iron-sulfur subunit